MDVASCASCKIDCRVRETADVDGGQNRCRGCPGAVQPSSLQKEQPDLSLNCRMLRTMARAGKSKADMSSMHRNVMGPSGVDTSVPIGNLEAQ